MIGLPRGPTKYINWICQGIGIDVAKFKVDIDSAAVKNKIQSDTNDANTISINQTPTFFLMGLKLIIYQETIMI